MHPIWGQVAGGFIIVMMLVFILIWVWAWLPHHAGRFADMAQLPMQDGDQGGDDGGTIDAPRGGSR